MRNVFVGRCVEMAFTRGVQGETADLLAKRKKKCLMEISDLGWVQQLPRFPLLPANMHLFCQEKPTEVQKGENAFTHSLVGTLEERSVHGVEAYRGGNKTEVRLGETIPHEESIFGQNFLAP